MGEIEALAECISARRRELGLTQEELAFAVGVNRRVIGELERGKASVQTGITLRVLSTLGLELRVEPRG